jgi:hypothetical protein
VPDHIDIIIKTRERISLLCQKGFPFVDSAFFENPTVLEAGLLLRRMILGVEPDEISQLLLHPKRIHQQIGVVDFRLSDTIYRPDKTTCCMEPIRPTFVSEIPCGGEFNMLVTGPVRWTPS